MRNQYLSQITINESTGLLNNVFSENYIIKFIGNGTVTLTGFNIPNNNSVMIVNNTGNTLTLKHNSNDSDEDNRMWFNNELDLTIPDNAMVSFKYFFDQQKYVMVSSAGTGTDGAEIDPLFSASPSKNITLNDLQKLKSLELDGNLFTVMSDGFTDVYNIEHNLSSQPRTVIFTRCNTDSAWTSLVANDQYITFMLQNVPVEDTPISIYWLALNF